jgi:hypothetical protein
VRASGAHTRRVSATSYIDADRALSFADVPAVDPAAVVDPHWLELHGSPLLPALYMPPTMAGTHSPLMRVLATVLIGVFLLATVLGICLTYGPPGRPF